MNNLRPNPRTYKILLSSPTKLKERYSEDNLLIESVNPSTLGSQNRHYYMLVFDFITESENNIIIDTHAEIGDYFCIALSVLYGKRFDNHGTVEGSGFFWIPNYQDLVTSPFYKHYPVYTNSPRQDVSMELDLNNFSAVSKFISKPENQKLWDCFFNAAKFYLSSIKSIESDLAKAYLDLITCGEILSSYYEYREEELYDSSLLELFQKLEQNNISDKDISLIKKRLYQVKRKFVLTLSKLITNTSFFEKTESIVEDARLTVDNFEKSIKSAYDIRSKYVHGGFQLLPWIDIYGRREDFLSEVRIPYIIPDTDDSELKKLLVTVPNYVGLERIIRFALLRFLHTNDIYIHSDLNALI